MVKDAISKTSCCNVYTRYAVTILITKELKFPIREIGDYYKTLFVPVCCVRVREVLNALDKKTFSNDERENNIAPMFIL